MGIKTLIVFDKFHFMPSEKPPHHMGIKTIMNSINEIRLVSEKPPHHMGIKTFIILIMISAIYL